MAGTDFKESGFMYLLGFIIVAFVVAQSLFFMIKAWKQGKTLGIKSATMKNTVIQSALFSVAPAIAILATVITLANALGLVLPWIRLSIVGNITYESAAATSVLEAFGLGSLNNEVTDPKVFTAAAWVMTIGSVFPLVIIPFVVKKVQKKVGKVASENARLADILAAAAFIGLMAAFIAGAAVGVGDKTVLGDGAGLLSVLTLLTAMVATVLLQLLCKKARLTWLEPFVLPLSMFIAMGGAILFSHILPEQLVLHEWRY